MRDRHQLILSTMRDIFEPATANQIIDLIYKTDKFRRMTEDDWRFYLQLNKLFAPLERNGLIVHTGYTKDSRPEKLWKLKK